jgi:hypothetical protein
MPLLEVLSDPFVQKPHWNKSFNLGESNLISFKIFLDLFIFLMRLLNFKDDDQDFSTAVQQEAKILTKLKETEGN